MVMCGILTEADNGDASCVVTFAVTDANLSLSPHGVGFSFGKCSSERLYVLN